MKIVSACLAGIKCMYNGESASSGYVKELVSRGEAIPVCPEILGGLPTPRTPAEILNGKVITKDGEDVTALYKKGAEEALNLAMLVNCKEAILKSNSPSCGYGRTYDGTFSGKLTDGSGVFAELLKKYNISIETK